MTAPRPNLRVHIGALKVQGLDAAGSRTLADALQNSLRSQLGNNVQGLTPEQTLRVPNLQLQIDATTPAPQGRQIAAALQKALAAHKSGGGQ